MYHYELSNLNTREEFLCTSTLGFRRYSLYSHQILKGRVSQAAIAGGGRLSVQVS